MSAPVQEEILPEGKVLSVWERHPLPDMKEQPVHFVRKRTGQRKSVDAMGLEDSQEWHRDHYKEFMHGEPWDRAVLVGCKQHYEDLRIQFPSMRHYWEDETATFGEQLLMDGIDADSICLGDILESTYGPLEIQVTCPRLCCFRVDNRYPAIPAIKRSGAEGTVRHWCSTNGRAGFLCRVLRPGSVSEGDTLKVVKRPHPQYPISYLSSLCYADTPLQIKFAGTEKQLVELCHLEDLCLLEWRERLIDLRSHQKVEHALVEPDSMGVPIPYEEGLALLEGEWCLTGTASHNGGHDGHGGPEPHDDDDMDLVKTVMGDSVTLELKGNEVHTDKATFEKKHWVGRPRNHHGNFALELDLGGFPSFPRFAFMTRVGRARGVIYLVFAHGGKWFKPMGV
eukprot:CAMPEP_0171094578 /NCGR_PEP_ID=MMETSP0766_2-20121228/41631_1 /TAXON_ID=439317 /ORGANISM="Gambierdiscus australes, Strain CAWD 149" /LENGTH=394 /DNA_ID=CAMNT_0011553247 /DNA_START=83 /DNA_END=1267 /DNA_ORIENTATION=-